MRLRSPSVRRPRTFYDVFAVMILGIAILTIVLSVWQGAIVIIEMRLFVGLLFLWAGWAVLQCLGAYTEQYRVSR
jgi:hypothetical protein